jgi:hypothetical protein
MRGVLVVLALGQFQQFFRPDQAFVDRADAVDGLVQQGTLAAQGLRGFGVVPDIRAFQLPVYFFQTLTLGVVVKDTPGARPTVPAGRRCAGGWDSVRSWGGACGVESAGKDTRAPS